VPVTVCWAAKGGSGATVVTATLALSCPTASLLVDLAGELPAVLGIEHPTGQGVADWLRSDAPTAALDDLAIEVDRTTRLIPRGAPPLDPLAERWVELVDCLVHRPAVFVDAGTGEPPPALARDDVRSLLVTRPCYLALQRLVRMSYRPDGIVLVAEPWRSLRPFDVERAVGAPVVARVSHDPAVPRAVDAGLLRARVPRLLARELRGAA
jgi:hypothetical protein